MLQQLEWNQLFLHCCYVVKSFFGGCDSSSKSNINMLLFSGTIKCFHILLQLECLISVLSWVYVGGPNGVNDSPSQYSCWSKDFAWNQLGLSVFVLRPTHHL